MGAVFLGVRGVTSLIVVGCCRFVAGGYVHAGQRSSTGIDGVITDARTGAPIPAFVEAYDPAGGNAGGANADESGRFDLFWLAPGEYRLRVIATDYVEQWAFGKSSFDEADPVTAPGTASIALTPLDYGSLAGRFVSTSGTPMANNSLVEVYDLQQNPVDRATTDETGSFRFPRLLAQNYKLHFTGPTGISQWTDRKTTFAAADELTVAPDTETTVTEVAFDGGNLEITVLDDVTSAPVPGACLASNDPQTIFVCTDADGRAVFTGITTGTYRVTISPPAGYLFGSVEEVVVRPNETTTVTAPLTARPVFAINMRDARTGAPVPGACVVVLEERDRGVVRPDHPVCADDQGQIRADFFFPGRYRLFAYATDGVHGSQWVGSRGGTGDLEQANWFQLASHQTTNVTVRLDRAGSISGVVRSGQNGSVVAGICPSVSPVAPDFFTPINVQCTGADGRYTISGLGPYNWRVQYPDFSRTYAWTWSGGAADRFAARGITVRAGQVATADANLPAGGKLSGHVTGATLPLQFIYVVATNARTGDWAAPQAIVRTGAEYTLSDLATQRIRLEYSGTPGDPRHYPDPVRVTAGTTTTLDLPA